MFALNEVAAPNGRLAVLYLQAKAGKLEDARFDIAAVTVEDLHLRNVVIGRAWLERQARLPPERRVFRWKGMICEYYSLVVRSLQNALLRASFAFSICCAVSLISGMSGFSFNACTTLVSAASSRPVFKQMSAMLL